MVTRADGTTITKEEFLEYAKEMREESDAYIEYLKESSRIPEGKDVRAAFMWVDKYWNDILEKIGDPQSDKETWYALMTIYASLKLILTPEGEI